jgi:hypothetical protein
MIYKKLLEFQQQQITLKKSGLNPHFNSKYVPLNEVLASVTEPLNKLGIVIVQNPMKDGLSTILHDTEDDTSISSFLPYVEITTAQKLGSNNTYNRRYALVTMLGLGDADDDGNEASAPSEKHDRLPEVNIPDGTLEVIVTDERHGFTNDKYWQKVKTGDGSAWNNEKNGLKFQVGKAYEVIVKGGNIIQGTELEDYNA